MRLTVFLILLKKSDIQRSIVSRSDQYLILNSKSNIQTKTYEIFDLKKETYWL